jgi:hypothetical protein
MAEPRRVTPAQIINHLRKVGVRRANGKFVKEVCKRLGVSKQTNCRWRSEYGGTTTAPAKKVREDDGYTSIPVNIITAVSDDLKQFISSRDLLIGPGTGHVRIMPDQDFVDPTTVHVHHLQVQALPPKNGRHLRLALQGFQDESVEGWMLSGFRHIEFKGSNELLERQEPIYQP